MCDRRKQRAVKLAQPLAIYKGEKLMSIILPIVELLNDGKIKGLGNHEFQLPPSTKDRIVVPGPMGDLEIMRVVYIEHSPVKDPRVLETEDMEPATRVYVEFEER